MDIKDTVKNTTTHDDIVSNEILAQDTIVCRNISDAISHDVYEDGNEIQQGFTKKVEFANELNTHERIGRYSNSMFVDNVRRHLPENTDIVYESVAESVIGNDDRVQVVSVNSSPWSMICQLIVKNNNGACSHGTGWFISPRTIITAGHCVYSHTSTSGWVDSVEVIPCINGHSRPYGSVVGTVFQSVRGWTVKKNKSYDYGCIILPREYPLGNRTGWFGFAKLSDHSLQNLIVNNSGYPADKKFGTQWFNADRILNITTKQLEYRLDTAGGQSGSPIWRLSLDKRHVVGIHAYGGTENKSTRIDNAVFNNMLIWKQLGSK